jgi:hypothetical protein
MWMILEPCKEKAGTCTRLKFSTKVTAVVIPRGGSTGGVLAGKIPNKASEVGRLFGH